MNIQERAFFEALSKHRAGLARALEDPALRGVRHSVVEKYSDQAHFIYELLQNADDALATNARFRLEKDRLIFAHNGKRLFSISNPDMEDEDSKHKQLGDINAITSIANSSKKGASIGKFGVGFKAVFQYTATPHIYDPQFHFKIERFIVPVELESDFPGRKGDETLFVFPFDHYERGKEESYNDISEKLRNLSYPLLFLSNLKNIEFEFDNTLGLYSKKVLETRTVGETKAEHIVLTQNDGDDLYDEQLWLFTRAYDRGKEYEDDSSNLSYSVGFFLDENGHICPVNKPAFCYFPTKEVTNLSFIIHAPFLLTDSREGIRAGVSHNNDMIQVLAELSADSIWYLRNIGIEKSIRLIDDDIVSIIPIDPSLFSDKDDRSQVSFLPFYEEIKTKFEISQLLPSTDGYVGCSDAYWASVPQLTQLFSNEQLADLVDNKNAKWVFSSLARDEVQRNKKDLFAYIDSLVRTNINEDIILSGRSRDFYVRDNVRQSLESIKGISPAFIEKQSFEWLHSLYKWISETRHRREISLDKPIFVDQDGIASAAYDDAKQLILFLPVPNVSGYKVVHPELLKNAETKAFVEQLGIKQPSLKDQIYNIILPQYQDDGDIDTDPHFQLFFEYYCKCSIEDIEEFTDLIKECEFLTYYKDGDDQPYRGAGNTLYLPTDELKTYFQSKKDTRFIALNEYKALVGSSNEERLMEFLEDIGVCSEIRLIQTIIDPETADRNDLPKKRSTRNLKYDETCLDGCKELIHHIENEKDEAASLALWKCLLRVIEANHTAWNYSGLKTLLRGRCHYFYYSPQVEHFESSDAILLKTKPWIMNQKGEFVTAAQIKRDNLFYGYDVVSEAARSLIDFLDLENDEPQIDDSNLSDEQREMIAWARKLKEYGLEDEKDLEEYLKYRRHKEESRAKDSSSRDEESSNELAEINSDDFDDIIEENSNADNVPIRKETSEVLRDIARRASKNRGEPHPKALVDAEETDSDELSPSSVDYSRKIEREKEKSAAAIERIAYLEELQREAEHETRENKYSYKWFTKLLELESLNSGETNDNSREVSISFARVEREPNTKRTLVLKHPSRYIPHFMEELADIPMVLHFGDQTKTVAIEVANIKSYTLRVKLKNSESIAGVDLDTVTSATIDAKSPAFLIEELRNRFKEFDYEDSFNMQENLCKNIEFVFGPPGTGKTTHLAKNVLIPMMQERTNSKVLVLTPTNKSADVLVRRIMEVSGEDHSFENWLIRFGATGDEEIEQSAVFRDKTFDIRTLEKSITVTTIARFPYDYFMPQGDRLFLHALNWDYIVIDEASMIPIADIVFPLYKKTPKCFIIAGDPFQIEPIASVNLWKDENIYSLVKLNSFVNPTTIHSYQVELLTTQYRSVPEIGYVFSNFAYGGILKHHRTKESQRPLNVGNDLGIETLNVIKFPVSKYESIYRCKKLNRSSSYQVYSALFVYEYVCYLSKAIAENNPGQLFKIGIIAPYRAQADMIDKLLASEKLPEETDVQVGTIHGFQGDECEIIFSIFNTPPTISDSREMFLNKTNIINVSISRARDYLFIVMPDDDTENIGKLRLVKKVENLIHNTDEWQEFSSPDLEELMFNDSHYFENNAFSTSHQSVNVYGLPEKYYEVRTEENAVDVQIHKPFKEEMKEISSENTDLNREKNQSYELDESVIPEELRKNAIDLPVKGAINGWCYLVPYNGKLKHYAVIEKEAMFIPILRNGQVKMVTVSVVRNDRIIYITDENFRKYEKELSVLEGIELRLTF
ncbi:MAG: AAA family ATPase [Clostridiales bacterium]|nr:AAA family ATPase [Clostridiales bacterium]